MSSLLFFSACDIMNGSLSNDTLAYSDNSLISNDSLAYSDNSLISNDSPTNDAVIVKRTIKGTAVDGYLKNSTVCLDINKNGICNSNEPTRITSNDGTFSFTTTYKGDYPILVSGGIDTATQESFVGTLKTMVTIDDDNSNNSNIIINPLTTLATNIYHREKENDKTFSYKDAKQIVASNLNLDLSKIDTDPLKDKDVFVKTQQVIQTIKLLSKSIEEDENDTIKTRKAFDYIMDQISSSVKDDAISADLNISKLVKKNREYNL
jgi:hypothetical protein